MGSPKVLEGVESIYTIKIAIKTQLNSDFAKLKMPNSEKKGFPIQIIEFLDDSVGAPTLKILSFGNSAIFVEV